MADLSGYKISFSKNPFFGTWVWIITAPDGRLLYPLFGNHWASRARAEQAALRRIEQDGARETLDGEQLRTRVEGAKGPTDQ